MTIEFESCPICGYEQAILSCDDEGDCVHQCPECNFEGIRLNTDKQDVQTDRTIKK